MPGRWQGSTRRARLPADWATTIVPRILNRDSHRCRLAYDGCTGHATEVDHRQHGDDHRDTNLQAACTWCHRKKTSAEGRAAQQPRLTNRRKPERHPGLR